MPNKTDKPKLPKGCEPGCELGPFNANQRLNKAEEIRIDSAANRKSKGSDSHPCNGDEEKYADRNFCASYSKGLPHYKTDHFQNNQVKGEVIPDGYCKMLKALDSGKPSDFEKIPQGCSTGRTMSKKEMLMAQTATRFAPATMDMKKGKMARPFVNPQAALAYDLEGFDSHQLTIDKAPKFNSKQEAGEMIELYWQAIARDVPFSEYATNPITVAAMADLNAFIAANSGEFNGPTEKVSGVDKVTAKTLFRGSSKKADCSFREIKGPHLSQFLLAEIPFGAQNINQRINTLQPLVNPNGTPGKGKNYLTDFASWLDVQQGCMQSKEMIDPKMRYIRNGRDLSQYVHIDVLFQAYFNAMLLLLQMPGGVNRNTGLNVPFDKGNFYLDDSNMNQDGFGTLGGPNIATIVCEVATRALKAIWFQKWAVHRRIRPEAFGGRVERIREDGAFFSSRYDVNTALLTSNALTAVENGIGTFPGTGNHLLPMAFPEGSPIHPSYGAGHATVAGACVTILKAWFDEDVKMSSLKDQNGVAFKFKEADTTGVNATDGVNLRDYAGTDATNITVGDELNKLAANIGIGRNHAGVHWRSDHDQSIRLGEQIAISILEDQVCTFNEDKFSFTFTNFDGNQVVIKRRENCPNI